MAEPEEFVIHIEPDGRIILEAGSLHEESYRRILEYLEETIGPVQRLEIVPDPPTTHIHPSAATRSGQTRPRDLRLERPQ